MEEKMSELPRTYQRFQSQYHELWKAYEHLGATAAGAGPIESKCRQLIKLGMAAANQTESAVKSHTHRALEAGATAEEIQHAVLLGITTIGFPATMAAFSWAQLAIADHTS
jgi:4-carboxymuconolactone decarboxylase